MSRIGSRRVRGAVLVCFCLVSVGAIAGPAEISKVAARDTAALNAQTLATGKASKACHDNYRLPDYEKENED
jgi:hypothetical protein